MESPDFDKFLLSVDDVPFLGLAIAVHDVACFEEAFGVEGLVVCFGVLEIACYDGRTADAEFAAGVVGGDVVAVIVNDSAVLSARKGS